GQDPEDRGVRHPQPAGSHHAVPAGPGDDRAARTHQGDVRGGAAGAARPDRAGGHGAPGPAVGRDPGGVAARDGERPVRIAAARAALLVLILGAWELGARWETPLLYIPPSRVGPALIRLLRLQSYPALPVELALTVVEVAVAFALAAGLGLALGFLLGLPRSVGEVYEPILS